MTENPKLTVFIGRNDRRDVVSPVMRRFLALAVTAALSASPMLLATSAGAEPPEYNKEGTCGPGDTKGARGIIMIGDGKAGGPTLYIDDRTYIGGNGLWLYKENNKYNFLQRGGKDPIGGSEICSSPDGIPPEEQTTDEMGNPTWKSDMCIF